MKALKHKISDYMTPVPETIAGKAPLAKASELMREYRIRHLVVEEAGKLIGVVSDRSVKAANTSKWADELKVEDVMVTNPYAVYVDADIETVIDAMIEDKYGSVIVKGVSEEVIGIFTTIDALKALRAVLPSRR